MPRFPLDQEVGCHTAEAAVLGRLLTDVPDVVKTPALSAAWPWMFIVTAAESDLSAVNWT